MIWVGIDTGTHTGLAVWDGRAFTKLETLPIHRALEMVARLQEEHGAQLAVVFEDARKRRWYGRAGREKLQGAGSIKRDAAIWQAFCEERGINFVMVPPRPGLTKWSADYFARVTGWKGRCSEHARDAALLVFGRGARLQMDR